MTEIQEKKCHAIIHSAAAAAATAGGLGAQIPMSDSAVIVPIQITMIISLGAVFGIELTKSAAASTLATATASMVGRGISQWLVGWIPGIGNIINASTAAGVTEAIGWAVTAGFDKNSRKK